MARAYDRKWKSAMDARRFGSQEFPFTQSAGNTYHDCPYKLLASKLFQEEWGEPSAYWGNVVDKSVKEIILREMWDDPDAAFAIALLREKCDGVDFSRLQDGESEESYRQMVRGFAERPESRVLFARDKVIGADIYFESPINGKYHTAGAIDILMWLNDRVAIVDLKSGMQHPGPYALAHNWQFATYANAVMHGTLWHTDPDGNPVGEPIEIPRAFPSLWWYHARYNGKYQKKTEQKKLRTFDENGGAVKVYAMPGDWKGDPWIPCNMDYTILENLLIPGICATIGAIRMGNFIRTYPDSMGGCDRCCRFKRACEGNVRSVSDYEKMFEEQNAPIDEGVFTEV